MAIIFRAPAIPKYTDPGQPGSPSGVPGSIKVPGDTTTTPPTGRPFRPPRFDPEPEWFGLRHEWIDTEGRVWDLTTGRSGVMLTRGGLRGLDFGKMTERVDSSPAVAGQRFRGAIHDPRDVFWPLLMATDNGSAEWMRMDSRWWQGLDPLDYGTWRVSVPGGAARTLRLRHKPDGDITPEMDPVKFGVLPFGLNFTADQPYWEGAEVNIGWGSYSKVPFYPGPPFTISSENAAENARLNNPGDVASYVRWYLVGPLDFVTVGVGTRSIALTFQIPEGQAVFLDTRPSGQRASLYNWDVNTRQFGSYIGDVTSKLPDDPDWEGSKIPRRATTALTVNMSKTGGTAYSVMTPLFYRGIPYLDAQAGAR